MAKGVFNRTDVEERNQSEYSNCCGKPFGFIAKTARSAEGEIWKSAESCTFEFCGGRRAGMAGKQELLAQYLLLQKRMNLKAYDDVKEVVDRMVKELGSAKDNE